MSSEILQIGSEKDKICVDLISLPYRDREAVFRRLSTQIYQYQKQKILDIKTNIVEND